MRRREHDALIELYRERIVAAETHVSTLLDRLARQERFYIDRIRELEDATRATSLDQLRGMHPTVAMELQPPEPERKTYLHDPTGLISTEIEPRDTDVDS